MAQVGQLAEGQQETLTLKILDSAGNTGTINGAPLWSLDNSVPATITPSTDGLSCLVKGIAANATAVNIGVTATSTDGTALSDTLALTIVGGAAVSIQIVQGTPASQ
jgi:hypothetical protein